MPKAKMVDKRTGKSHIVDWNKNRAPTRQEFDELIQADKGVRPPILATTPKVDPPPAPMSAPSHGRSLWDKDQGTIGSRLKTSWDTLYGGESNPLPRIRGVNEPILPDIPGDPNAARFSPAWVGKQGYDMLRSSSSLLGAATDVVTGAGLGKVASKVLSTGLGQKASSWLRPSKVVPSPTNSSVLNVPKVLSPPEVPVGPPPIRPQTQQSIMGNLGELPKTSPQKLPGADYPVEAPGPGLFDVPSRSTAKKNFTEAWIRVNQKVDPSTVSNSEFEKLIAKEMDQIHLESAPKIRPPQEPKWDYGGNTQPGRGPLASELSRAQQTSMYVQEPPKFSLPDVEAPGMANRGLNTAEQSPLFGKPKEKGLFGQIAEDSWKERGLKTVSSSRSIMSSMDFSAPRQAVAMIGRKEFWKNTPDLVKNFFSPKHFDEIQKAIKQNPKFERAKKNGLKLTDVIGETGKREEEFAKSYIEMVPGFKQGIEASNRSFTGFLNKVRMDAYSNFTAKAEKLGVKQTEKFEKDLVGFLNSATGRGDLGGWEKHADLFNQVLFSPRLAKSRLDILNPVKYYKMDPFVRKEALKTVATSGAAIGGALELANLGGLGVGLNPESPDFLKIKKGDSRFDIMGGHQQFIRAGLRIGYAGAGKAETGEFGRVTPASILGQLFENKLSPGASYGWGLLTGKDFKGDAFEPGKEVGKRLAPMIAQDLYDIYKENPEEAHLIFPGLFGVSVQTYKDKGNPREKPKSGKAKRPKRP